jgi:hypothetical protein
MSSKQTPTSKVTRTSRRRTLIGLTGAGRICLGGENRLERGPRIGRTAGRLDDQTGFAARAKTGPIS